MKTLASLLVFLFISTISFSQRYQPMTADEEITHESFKVSYNARFIKNRKTQDVYDIEISVKNEGHDFIKLKKDIGQTEFNLKRYAIVEVRFENATGSNLTVKDGFIIGENLNKDVTFEVPKSGGEEDETTTKTDRFLLGYAIMRGQIVDETFRVRVPKDEKPQVTVRFLEG